MQPVYFKYRPFDERTVQLLCADEVYFADPSTFNDPLDTKPRVEPDCDVPTLERTVQELVRLRVAKEMQAGARTVHYRGPKTMAHIDKHSLDAGVRAIDQLRYAATDPEYGDEPNILSILLAHEIERELLMQYDKGILSLASRYDCPLMWSHYGAQHRGLCIGYAVPKEAQSSLHQVQYDGDRNVRASEVAKMVLQHDDQARQAVNDAVLLRKAPDWKYEKEWRLLGNRGSRDSPLELVDVTFGMRCPSTIMHTVARMLADRDMPVAFHVMHEVNGKFRLDRHTLDVDELSAAYPRRSLSMYDGFEAIDESQG
ncbi:DUF2971 domain-containing protein [Paraburkholderia azotifigens]|nr:DUF2971 domain-containing protein [Paraburkholderia azotifigens]